MVCVLCLKAAEIASKHIYINSQEGQDLKIAEIIETHFWLQFDDIDVLSRSVCDPCWQKLCGFHEFYLNIQSIHGESRETFGFIGQKDAQYILETESANANECSEDHNIETVVYETENESDEEDMQTHEAEAAEVGSSSTMNTEVNHSRHIAELELADSNINGSEITMEEFDVVAGCDSYIALPPEECEAQSVQDPELEREKQESDKSIACTESSMLHAYAEVEFNCSYCHKQCNNKQMLHSHLQICQQKQSNEFHCVICDKALSSATSFEKHMKCHVTELEVQAYLCSNCGLINRDKEDLLLHISNVDTACSNAEVQQEILSVAYTCEFCSLDFKCTSDLKAHRATGVHIDKIYSCPVCNKRFKELKKMRNHNKSDTKHEAWQAGFPLCRLFACNVGHCEETYAHWAALYQHKQRSHKRQICAACNNIFSSTAVLEKHRMSCQSCYEYQCHFCAKKCPTKMSLSVHIARSHNEKNLVCPTCKSNYKDKKSLQQHVAFMHVSVQCSHCHKVIKNRRNLRTHIRVVHMNEQRYFCKICQKGFYHRSEKDMHEKNIHTDVMYKCGECTFTTNYAKSMDVHISMHTSELEFTCPICAKKFGRKHVLNLHISRHQVERQFICAERIVGGCSASFVSNYLLNKHIQQKHAISNRSVVVAKRRRSNICIYFNEENIDDPANFDPNASTCENVIETIDDCIELVLEEHEDILFSS